MELLRRLGGFNSQATDAEDAQRPALLALMWVAIVSSMAAWYYLASDFTRHGILLDVFICLTLAFILARAISSGNLGLAKVFFFLISLAGATAVTYLTKGIGAATFLLPIFASAVAFWPLAALITGSASASILVLLGIENNPIAALGLVLFGVCCWLALRPFYEVLFRYSCRNLEATMLAERLRDQRGELNRIIKDLDASYRLLQETNRQLSLAREEADVLRNLRHQFATNLSHELRTPLNIIVGFSQLIYRKPQVYGYSTWSETLRRDIGQIQRSAAYLSDLLDDVIDLARIDALVMPLQRSSANLVELVQETLATVDSLAREKNLQLQLIETDSLPALEVDPVRIRQVIFNLLTNAIRFTEAGKITISLQLVQNEVLISVEDTGCGISNLELETIFDEFHQVGRPKKDGTEGKGLGLAIAKRFVQLHGGRIWAESCVGQGSIFRFTLPLAHKTVIIPSQSRPFPTATRKEQPLVLVLDEDSSSTDYLSRRLDHFRFLQVKDMAEAEIATLTQSPVALVANRPVDDTGTSGDPAQCLSESTLILECNLPSREWLLRDNDFAAVLTKPVTQEGLVQTLQRLLPECSTEVRVVVLDDDRGFVRLLVRMLETAGEGSFRILPLYDATNAVEAMADFHPDVVLLDLLMPEMSGFAVLSRMREDAILHSVPAIAVTAATPGEDLVAARAGVMTLMRKGGFRSGEQLRLLESALEAASDGALLSSNDIRQPETLPVAPVS